MFVISSIVSSQNGTITTFSIDSTPLIFSIEFISNLFQKHKLSLPLMTSFNFEI